MRLELGESRLRFREGRLPGVEYRVLAYGDSLTAGYWAGGRRFEPYAASLEEAAPEVACDHIGLSGWTVQDMVGAGTLGDTLERARAADEPYDLAIVMAGTNDLGHREAEAIAADVWGLHTTAHALEVPTLAIGVPGSLAQFSLPHFHEKAQDVNRRIEEHCARIGRLAAYTPCPVAFTETMPEDSSQSLWEADGLHMSALGYQTLGRALVPLVRARLRLRAGGAAGGPGP